MHFHRSNLIQQEVKGYEKINNIIKKKQEKSFDLVSSQVYVIQLDGAITQMNNYISRKWLSRDVYTFQASILVSGTMNFFFYIIFFFSLLLFSAYTHIRFVSMLYNFVLENSIHIYTLQHFIITSFFFLFSSRSSSILFLSSEISRHI